jgi:cell division protein FtsL
MTARPIRRQTSAAVAGLRVIVGRRGRQRHHVAPWLAFTVVVVVALIGVVLAQTSLDRGAFELGSLNREIAQAKTENQRLRLDIARLESPVRVAPMAEGMGLVYPEERQPMLVQGVVDSTVESDQRWSSISDFASEETAVSP